MAVVGLSRNVQRRVKREVKRINQQLIELGAQPYFCVVESDSTDATLKELEALSKEMAQFQYRTLGKLESQIPNRIERLVHCRNKYVEELRFDSVLREADLVLVVDFDIRNSALNLESLFNFIYTTEIKWDAICCNQKGRYFDIYALRAENWNSEDCFQQAHEYSHQMSNEKAKEKAIWQKMKWINRKESPIFVESAFGGMTIYRKEVFNKYDYSSDSILNLKESEHVLLHKKLRQGGGTIIILPEFTNFRWNPHNLASFRIFRRIDKLSRQVIPKSIRKMLRRLLD